MALRIALTVLPVGPRGASVLRNNAPLWFALQISAGFADITDPSELDKLWPWLLHIVRNDTVALRAWVVNVSGPVDHTANVPPPEAFTDKFRQSIKDAYASASVRTNLDLRLLFPEEATEEHQRVSFPSRLQYLATLPGELSRRLLATLYFQIPVADLFTKDANQVWQPNGATLWVAPKSVNGSAEVVLAGNPQGAGNGRFSITADDNGTPIVAIGPGYALADFLAAPSTIFNLHDYKVPVLPGDRRFIDLESLLLNVLDPFGELHDVRNSDARNRIELVNGSNAHRAITSDAFDVLVDAWRVRAFADSLHDLFRAAIDELLALLLPAGDPPLALSIPDRWGSALDTDLALTNLLTLADKLAPRIGVPHAEDRATLGRVSERAGFAQFARMLVQAFDEALNATPSASDGLREAWRFGSAGVPLAQLNERRATLALAAIAHVRERIQIVPLLPGLATQGVVLHDVAKAALDGNWTNRAADAFRDVLLALGLATNDEHLSIGKDVRDDFVSDYLDAVLPHDAAPGPELPGKGLPLQLGAEEHRLVHESDTAADQPYREVAGVLLLARRGKNDGDIDQRPWRIITGGAAAIDIGPDTLFLPADVQADQWLHELLAIPLRPVFQQKVRRADVEYHGQPMLAKSALDHAYAEDAFTSDAPIEQFDAAYTFQPVGNFEGDLGDAAKAGRAPVLRYGDVYEFRGGVIDQAGGLPPEVASAAEPWRLDVAKLTAATTHATTMAFPRTVPPGEVNVLPEQRWPVIPDDVALRVREFRAVNHRDADSIPVLLLTSASDERRFTIVPPSIDEHTLLRWALPALDDPNAAAVIADLKTALGAVLEKRGTEAVVLHDPAVSKLGLRITAAGNDNTVVELFHDAITPAPTAIPFQLASIPVHVKSAAFGMPPQAQASAAGVEITLPEGTFAILEAFPLITDGDYQSRFFPFEDMTDDSVPFAGHVAFHPSVVLLETATAELPAQDELFANLQLIEQNGDVAIRFDGAVPNRLVFVDRFTLERDRWVWRNLPVVRPDSLTAVGLSDDERHRLAASGPPDDVFGNDRDGNPAVAEWERIASIDRGFADRGEVAGRWPRLAPAGTSAGGPGNGVLLSIDNRDGVTAADYLRFRLRVRSRYAGVLPSAARERRASHDRRIVAGFRGDKVKPPKILGIVPLTASLKSDPLATPPGVTPFLVLLDETFFREYGVGERIDAHLALEKLDIGEDPNAATLPYRTGPLPDHWLADGKPFRNLAVTQQKDEEKPIVLDLFGPFGYSLDVTPSEALANASAFVAYPPSGVDSQWAMFIRLRRLLDKPSGQLTSDWSDTRALYTLRDQRLLASIVGPNPHVELTDSQVTLRNLRFILDPQTEEANSAAASQYRYFLLVSRLIPGAAQGFDAELPAGLWRLPLFDPANGYQPPKTFAVEFQPDAQLSVSKLTLPAAIDLGTGEYRGRLIEVLLNGRYDAASRMDEITGWAEFWKSLLDDTAKDEVDAAGMIRRVSDAFVVSG